MPIRRVRVYSKELAKSLKGKTDWDKLKTMTDADIKTAIKKDPDTREFTDYELTQFKPFMLLKRKFRL